MRRMAFFMLLACVMFACDSDLPAEKKIVSEKPDVEVAALKFVAGMGVGWNLGNTLDAKGEDETVWGNPVTTKIMIDSVRAKGFKTIRVPVTWQYHMGAAPDYTIEEEWLDRVEEVVNYGLDNDMYVIINIHHDEEWIIPTYENKEQVKGQLIKVWSQIANHFIDYDEHLIFELLNEPRLKGSPEEWKGGTSEGRDCINEYNQVSVEAIRATGGLNDARRIMVSAYAASASEVALNDLKLPESDNLIVSVHNYFPYNFCQGNSRQDWGTNEDKLALDKELDRLVELFISKGIPVITGEWGSLNQENTADRISHAKYYAEGCLKRGICPVWWDNGNKDQFGIFDRQNLVWFYPGIAEAIIGSQN